MRILVISDTHGQKWNLKDAVEAEPTAEIVYFLGDGYREFEELKLVYEGKKQFIGVIGNCDLGSTLPVRDIRGIENAKIYASHGFREKVKWGTYDILYEAKQCGCNLVFFGHTHEKLYKYVDGVHLFNPGSLRDGFYGVVDITENGIICINKSV